MTKRNKLIIFAIDILFLALTLVPGAIFLHHTYDLIQLRTTVWALHNGVFEHLDFVSFYACGMMMLHGQSQDIYDTTAQLAAYNQVISPAKVPYTNFLQHVPYVFTFLPLIALMPLRTAYLAWSLASVLSAFLGTCILRLKSLWTLDKKTALDTTILALTMLSSLSGNFCLLDGQISWFYFVFLALFSWSFLAEKQLCCGVSLALLSIKPQYFVFMALPLIVQKQKKAVLTATIGVALLIVLAGFTVGWQNVLHYPQVLLHGESAENFALERPKTMISVRSILSILLPNKMALIGCFICEALGLVACALVWSRSTSADQAQKRSSLVFSQIMMLVVSAHYYLYEGLLLAAPALLALPSWRLSQCLETKGPQRQLLLLLLFFPLANLAILLLTPTLAAIVLPAPVLEATADSGVKGNLLMYVGLFLYNLAILVAAARTVRWQKA